MNKTILITGATSGIGKACAEKFAAAGHNIIITGRRQDRLDELSSALQSKFNVKVLSLCFDVQDKDAVSSALNNIPAECRKINILINNAGLALGRDSFEDADMQDWETMLNTNVHGLLYVSKAILPFMIEQGGGHIINMGSIAGKEVYEKGNVYCASKFAVDAISRSMRIDLMKHHIKVTSINPGAVETEFSLVRFKGEEAKAMAAYRGRDFVTPDDVQSVCVPVLNHRIILTPEREMEGLTTTEIIKDIIKGIDVPR